MSANNLTSVDAKRASELFKERFEIILESGIEVSSATIIGISSSSDDYLSAFEFYYKEVIKNIFAGGIEIEVNILRAADSLLDMVKELERYNLQLVNIVLYSESEQYMEEFRMFLFNKNDEFKIVFQEVQKGFFKIEFK